MMPVWLTTSLILRSAYTGKRGQTLIAEKPWYTMIHVPRFGRGTEQKDDHMWQGWLHEINVTTCYKCNHVWQLWLNVKCVTTSWMFGLKGHSNHKHIIDIWTSWIFSSLTFEALLDKGHLPKNWSNLLSFIMVIDAEDLEWHFILISFHLSDRVI